jgi:hypothetical protein
VEAQTVSLVEVLAAARAGHASLVPECAGYLVLYLARAMRGAPVMVEPASVLVSTEGAVGLSGARRVESQARATERLRRLLAALLDVASGAAAPALTAVSRVGSEQTVEALVARVRAALVPLNRGAARRSLARVCRETLRAHERGALGTLDDIALAPPPGRRARAPAAPRDDSARPESEERLLEGGIESDPIVAALAVEPSPPPSLAEPTPTVVDAHLEEDELGEPNAAATPPAAPPLGVPPQASAVERIAAAPVPEVVAPARVEPVVAVEHVAPTIVDAPPVAPVDGASPGAAVGSTPEPADAPAAAPAVAPAPPAPAPPAPPAPLAVEAPADPEGAPGDPAVVRPASPRVEPRVLRRRAPLDRSTPATLLRRALGRGMPSGARAETAERAAPLREDPTAPLGLRFDAARALRVWPNASDVDALVDRFAEDAQHDPLRDAKSSLRRLAGVEGTPMPADVEPSIPIEVELPEELAMEGFAARAAGEVRSELSAAELAWFADERASVPASPSPSPVAIEHAPQALSAPPPAPRAPHPRRRRATRWLAAIAACAAGAASAFLWGHHPELVPGMRSVVPAPAFGPSMAGPCEALVRLRGLPSPHEILLHLGTTPLRAGPLPAQVHLEFVVTSPGHRASRLVVPADAAWVEVGPSRTLPLATTLAPAPPHDWPVAPEAQVGGVGPAGFIELSSAPAGADAWLVVGAGEERVREIPIGCADEARLLVVAPREPTWRRPLLIEGSLLRAAASTGTPVELSLR